MYEDKTYDYLIAEMLDNVTADVDKSEGSLIYDALAPVAMELEQNYIEMDEILKRVFAQTSYEEFLDMRAAEFGVIRKAGTKAIGKVTFTGSDNTIIPTGTIVQTESGLQYSTIADVTIANGTVKTDVRAEDIGIIYNVPANTITEIPVSVTGVASVTNVAIIGGAEIETDADLISRLLLKVQIPSTSGNANDYKLWAMSVDGVGDAKAFPIWAGNGTVRVVIIDSNKKSANTSIISAVANKIEANRPIGANVAVVSATEKQINISAKVVIDTTKYTLGQVQSILAENITKYFAAIAFKNNYVSYASIGNVIFNSTGVQDYSNLTINTKTDNVVLADEEIPIVGTINLEV
jgi:uncharacterized phage protein gp47/JayE